MYLVGPLRTTNPGVFSSFFKMTTTREQKRLLQHENSITMTRLYSPARQVTAIAVILACAIVTVHCNDCGTLQCVNSDFCLEQAPEFESHRLPDGTLLEMHAGNSQFHCSCFPGWTGIACDVPFDSCDGDNLKC